MPIPVNKEIKQVSYNGTNIPLQGKPEETFIVTPKVISQTITPTSGKVFSSGTVNPIYEEISTSAGMDAVNIDANVGKMYKYTGTTDTKYTNNRLYIVEAVEVITDLTNTTWQFYNSGIVLPQDAAWYSITFSEYYYEMWLDPDRGIWYVDEDGSVPLGNWIYDPTAGWMGQSYRTISITGGTDVRNTDLINFITSNAVRIS